MNAQEPLPNNRLIKQQQEVDSCLMLIGYIVQSIHSILDQFVLDIKCLYLYLSKYANSLTNS